MPVNVTLNNFDRIVAENAKLLLIVDFWADWCGPCHAIAPVLENVEKQYEGKVVIAKVNVDEEPELADSFNIRGIPNLIIFQNGEPVESITGVIPQRDLVAIVEELL